MPPAESGDKRAPSADLDNGPHANGETIPALDGARSGLHTRTLSFSELARCARPRRGRV
jgi:hypothetical protein